MRQHSSYNSDFYKWSKTQAALLKKGQFDKVDMQNVVEELESLGRSDRRALESYLQVLLRHLLKSEFVPEQKGNSRSWEATILNSRLAIKSLLKDSPSLKKELSKMLQDKETYKTAREIAIIETNLKHAEETFPLECPWSLEEVLTM